MQTRSRVESSFCEMLTNLSVLVKPVSGDCNLACEYCFYHDRPTDPYRGQVRHRMKDRVLRSLIRQMMEMAGPEVSFGWQGGEPTLAGLDFFERVVAYERRYGRSGQIVANGIQTNGWLIDDRWAAFFRRYKFLVGISLDGPEKLHDRYRRTPSGRGTHARVMRAIETLRRHGVEFNILAVVNACTVEKPIEIYDYFLSHGFHYLQFIPCVEIDPETGQITDFSVQPEQYGRFLCRLFDCWYNKGYPRASERTFDAVLMAYMGMEPQMCVFQERCGAYVVVEYNGDVYPCDFLVREDLRLGNILERPLREIVMDSRFRAFASAKSGYPECEECRWDFICHGGCQRMRGIVGEENKQYLCEAYKQFFNYSERGFLQLRDRLRAEKQSRVSNAPTSKRAVGRNDPCPCGSGKKYKHCCMKKEKGQQI